MINHDLPITTASDDILNRGSFADSLAQTLLQCSFPSSFVIGLYGEWGSGKTSLLNMVFEKVKETNEEVVIIKFNPWLCSDPKQLITQFFKQMTATIKSKKSVAETAWKLIDKYATSIFDITSIVFPIASSYLNVASNLIAAEAKERVDENSDDLQDIKERIGNALRDENIKLIVSIDDIDRLSKDEIIAVFQLVKSLADFPNTVYLLAFDYNVVVKALGEVQYGDGKDYLEKIIQMPFKIPAPNMQTINDTLFSKLNTIIADIPDEKFDRATWSELFRHGLTHYIKSIRDVIRYVNVFSLKYELLKNETDVVDLLGVTCLQVFEPMVYSKLPYYKDSLCGTNIGYSNEQQKEEEEKLKKVLSELVPNNTSVTNFEAANNIIGILFPKTKKSKFMLYGFGRSYSHNIFLINNNIASPECFERYFSLTLEDGAIPTSIIEQLVYEDTESDFLGKINGFYKEGKIERLLEEIEAYAKRTGEHAVSEKRACLMIKCLSHSWHNYEVEDGGMFAVPFHWRVLSCLESLLNRIELKNRYAFICSVFNDKDVQPYTLSLLLQDFETQHGRFTEKSSSSREAIVSLEEVIELEEIYKTRVVEAIDSGEVFNQPRGLSIFWLLEKIDIELTKDKKKSIITDDISLAKVISSCTSRGTLESRVVTKVRNTDMNKLAEFIDTNEAYKRVKEFIKTDTFLTLTSNEQMDVMAFILKKERTASNTVFDHGIAEETIQKELQKLINKQKCTV